MECITKGEKYELEHATEFTKKNNEIKKIKYDDLQLNYTRLAL